MFLRQINNKMKLLLIIASIILLGFSSCEKPMTVDTEDGKEQKNSAKNTSKDDVDKTDTVVNRDSIHETIPSQIAYTVSEAMDVNPSDTPIIVRGYIIGATSRSMNNAQFSAPFTYTSNILIMDKPNTDGFDMDEVNIMPVKISDATSTKRALNLKDHPEYLNQKITICGFRKEYLHSAGLVNVLYFSIETSEK